MSGTECDAVGLNVMLPGMHGLEVCRAFRAREAWSPIPILTARDAIGDP